MASVAATSQPPTSPMSSPLTSTTGSADAAEVSQCPERVISLDPSVHPQVYHAWRKYCQVGIKMTGTNTRALNSSRLRRGIEHALEQTSKDVRTVEEQQDFVSRAWGRYRNIQREDFAEEMRIKAHREYESHVIQINYADIGETPASFDKLSELLRQKGTWWRVVSDENSRIAAEKRRRKERDLINSKFGHLPESERLAAYNRFKAENERISSNTVKVASDTHKREFLKWLKENPDFFKLGNCDAWTKAQSKINYEQISRTKDNMVIVTAAGSHMLEIVKHLMGKVESARMSIRLSYDGDTHFSPRHVCYSSIHGCMKIHNTARLVPNTYDIDAVIDDNIVFSSCEGLSGIGKRLPDQFHGKFHAYIKQHNLIEYSNFRKVYTIKPEFIAQITLQTTDKCFIVNKSLRTHNAKPIAVTLKTIDEKWSFNKAHQSVMNSLEQDLASKPRSPRPNRPTVNTNSDIVAQLTQLKIMKTEGDITEKEFLAAKYSLFKQ